MTHPAVPRFPHRAHGPVGVLDAESVDGRSIDSTGFTIAALPIPLMAVYGGDPRSGHAGAKIAGRIDGVTVDRDTGRVVVSDAITELPPGEYPCGMDLRGVAMRFAHPDGRAVTEDELRNDTHLELLQLVEAGELIAVTVYVGGSHNPAFPGSLLTVEAGR